MSKSIVGSFIIVWFIFCCINVSVQEDDDINNVKEHRIKRKVADYHQFLKDEKLTPEMQSLLIQVLRLERRKRALHKTRKKSRQFMNNSIYHNPGQKTKKFIGNIKLFTLPTTQLDSIDDNTVSIVTKPMSFWLKPLSSEHEHIKQGSDKEDDSFDLNYWSKNPQQRLLNSKKNPEPQADSQLDIIDREDEDANDSSEDGFSPEIQGSEDVLGLENSKQEALNKVIDDMLKDDDGDAAFGNITNSKKREIRFPLAIRTVTQGLIPIPMNINRDVSVLTKPSFYWLNQNKQLVNNMLLNNTMQPEASNLNNSISSNARIVYYANSSPKQANIVQNSSLNQNTIPANSQPPGGKLELTPLEIVGLNRSAQEASNINISKEVSLTTKAAQYWLNMAQNVSQNSEKSNPKPKKATNTSSILSVNSLEAKPINISEQVSLLTKPSHYWTDPYMKNTTETNLNVSVTKSVRLDGFTERVKMMAVNLSNIIPLVNKPASEWIPQAKFGSSTALNSRQNISELKPDGRGFNQLAPTNFVQQTNNGDVQNQSYFHNVSSSNTSLGINTKTASTNTPLLRNEYQNISHGASKSRSADMSVIRQPYAINEVPKIYFQQKQANKTKESNPQNPGAPPINDFVNSFQNFPNNPKDSFVVEHMAGNSLQGQSNIPQVADLSMPERLFNNSPIAQSNPINYQNEAIMDKGPLLPQVYYTGALAEFNGYQNGFMQNNGRNNSTVPNENPLGHEVQAAANISPGTALDLSEFPKTTFLNETRLVQDLETPNNNGNAIESLQFRNNALLNQNPPQFNQETFRNTSMNQNNFMINEDQAEANYNGNKNGPQFKNNSINFIEPKNIVQSDDFSPINGINDNELLNLPRQNNFENQYVSPFSNVSISKLLPLQDTQNINGTHQYFNQLSNNQVPLNLIQNSKMVATQNQNQNESMAQFQDTVLAANSSLTNNTFWTNETNNNMLSKDNMQQPFVNNTHLLSIQSPASLKNISVIESSFTNSFSNNQMFNNASSSQFQGPSPYVNNSFAIKPNEADSQIVVNNSQLQDQVHNSVTRNPFSTNEMNQMNYNQSPAPFANNSLVRNQFSVNQMNYNPTLSQRQHNDEKQRKEVKPAEQLQNTVITNRNVLAKGSMVKTLNDSITMAFKNTTDNLNKAQKRDTYYERFGEQEPSYSDEYEPHHDWKRGKPLNIYSDGKEYQPHIYRKREVPPIDEESSNSNFPQEFDHFKKKKSVVPLDLSQSESDEDEEYQSFHKTIKRASPVFNYEEEPENIDGESNEIDEQVLHQSFKRDSAVVGDESDYQDNPEHVDSESNVAGEDALDSILRESLKSRSAGIEINNDGGDTLFDPNLENPKFQKFLQQYVSDLASIGRKRSNGFGGSTKPPTLVEALQKYIRSSYESYSTTPVYPQLSSTDLSTNQLDIIDMNSLLRTVDVLSTVDRYGYALEEPSRTKPSTKIEPYIDFSIMTKIPFLIKSPFHLAINNIRSDNIVRKSAQVTPTLPSAIVKLRAAGTSNLTAENKLSKKSALITKKCFANDAIETDLLSFQNVLKEYHDNKNLPWDRLKDIFDAVNDIRSDKFGRSSGSVSGMFCNFNGSWLSTVAGMRIDLNQTDNNTFIVSLASKTPPPKGGLLYTTNCTDWLLSARLPMKKTSIIQVTGINEKEKKLAVFLGECRVCNDKNLVYGHWIVLRESRDCEDVFSTQESYTDLWRQEGLHTLRLHNLQMLKMSLTTTEKPSTVSGDIVTALEGNVTISIANGTIAIISGATGITGGVPAPTDTITSMRPDDGATVVPLGDGAAVITGVVPPDGVTAGTVGGMSEVPSTESTNAVNIIVGKKRIAIKL